MDTKEFWEIISLVDQRSLDDSDDEQAVQPLIIELSTKSESEVSQFQECLAQVLYAIDGQRWMEQAGDSSDSADGFLYVRCYVVARGKEYYSTVLGDPNLMPKSSDQWAESLLYVAGQAWSEITGNDEDDYDCETTVSYESFSNDAQW